MQILITGSTGLLGQALARHLAPAGDVTGCSRHAPAVVAPPDLPPQQVKGQAGLPASHRGGQAGLPSPQMKGQAGAPPPGAPACRRPATADRAGRPACAAPLGYVPGAAGRHVVCDLTDAGSVAALIRSVHPEVVIHTQACSDVDRCEKESGLAQAMNVATTAHLAEALQGTGARLVYLSTDYVFDGAKGSPYDEADAPRPLSVYGRSKLEGERLALGYPRGIVVRPSTLFGPGRMNYCDHVARQVLAGQPVEAFRDQVTSPTYTRDLAEAIGDLVRALARRDAAAPGRVFHIVNAGGCSRETFAYRVADLLGCPRDSIRLIRMAEQRRPAPRPAYTALTSRCLAQVIGRSLRPWDEALQAYLREQY